MLFPYWRSNTDWVFYYTYKVPAVPFRLFTGLTDGFVERILHNGDESPFFSLTNLFFGPLCFIFSLFSPGNCQKHFYMSQTSWEKLGVKSWKLNSQVHWKEGGWILLSRKLHFFVQTLTQTHSFSLTHTHLRRCTHMDTGTTPCVCVWDSLTAVEQHSPSPLV